MSIPVRAFHIEQEVTIAASPVRVFDALTTDVAAWWGMPHMYAEDARDIVLEPRVGGRFYEDWGNGEGALYATVAIARRPERLRLVGSMGMRGAVAGVIEITLAPQGPGTTLRLSHRAVGEVTEETETGYRDGWRGLLAERLKNYVERGVRSGLKR